MREIHSGAVGCANIIKSAHYCRKICWPTAWLIKSGQQQQKALFRWVNNLRMHRRPLHKLYKKCVTYTRRESKTGRYQSKYTHVGFLAHLRNRVSAGGRSTTVLTCACDAQRKTGRARVFNKQTVHSSSRHPRIKTRERASRPQLRSLGKRKAAAKLIYSVRFANGEK